MDDESFLVELLGNLKSIDINLCLFLIFAWLSFVFLRNSLWKELILCIGQRDFFYLTLLTNIGSSTDDFNGDFSASRHI
jgi:uncharacterized membrane protein YbhN (UPF0104 family)